MKHAIVILLFIKEQGFEVYRLEMNQVVSLISILSFLMCKNKVKITPDKYLSKEKFVIPSDFSSRNLSWKKQTNEQIFTMYNKMKSDEQVVW